MFIGTMLVGGGNGELFFRWFSIYFPFNDFFQPWQVITHLFMHANFEHLLFNMLLLFFVGTIVERYVGKKRFLFLYISAGLGAALISFIVDYINFNLILSQLAEGGFSKEYILSTLNEGKIDTRWAEVIGENTLSKFTRVFFAQSLGASGAIMGIMAAFGFMFPNMKVMLIIPPIPIKVKYLVVGMIGSDLISAFLTGTPLLGTSNTGYVAHVGGALTGFIIAWYWKKNQFNQNRWN